MNTVANCSNLQEALLLKSMLEANGVIAVIPDELTAQMAPPYLFANAGVRVQVQVEDTDKAMALLAESRPAPEGA